MTYCMMPKLSCIKRCRQGVHKLPGTTLIGNITIIISATAVKKKFFLDLHSKAKQLIYAVKESLEV